MVAHVLTLNAGSSSIKFALFSAQSAAVRARGEIDGLGARPRFVAQLGDDAPVTTTPDVTDHASAVRAIMRWVARECPTIAVAAVGHRVVHGGTRYDAPCLIDGDTLSELAQFIPLAPLHQPHNLAGVSAARDAFPDAPQVACFDTAFHRGHAFVDDAYALPHDLFLRGVRRFGFHGLSYEYIARRLRESEPELARGRVVVAHLGAGASLCALRDGRSVATTMGFSPLDGLPMATRCGAIDPGALLYLLQNEQMSASTLAHLLYRESGLKGLSGLSGDLRELEASDTREAARAIDYFVHRLRVEIAAMAATLEGLDALVFTAGIGEHSARVRAGAVEGLVWLGFALDHEANLRHAARISAQGSRPALVMRTDEERMIALHTIKTAELPSRS